MRFDVFSLLTGLAFSCSTGHLSYENFERIPRDSDPVHFSSPLPERNEAGMIFIPVRFNGREFTCLLDTGSPTSILYADPYFQSLPYGGKLWMQGVSGERAAVFKKLVETTEIGGVGLHRQKFLISELSLRHGFSCLIGMDTLAHGVISLDFNKHEFQWLKDFPPQIVSHPMVVTSVGRMMVPFRVGDEQISAFLDTGASITVLEPKVLESHRGIFALLGHHKDGWDALNHPLSYDIYRAKPLSMAGVLMEGNVSVEHIGSTRDDSFDGLVGYNLIRKLNWLLDPQGQRWANF